MVPAPVPDNLVIAPAPVKPMRAEAGVTPGERMLYACLLAAAMVRLWIVPLGSGFWLDETGTFWAANSSFLHVFERTIRWPTQPPLYGALAWLMLHSGGPPEVMLRLPSVAAMALATYFLYRVGVRLFEQRTALVATVIFASMEAVAFAAADARSYAIGLAAAVGATLVLLRWIERPRWREVLAYSCLAALVWYMHMVLSTIFIVHALYLAYRRPAGILRQAIAAAAMMAALLLPSIPHVRAMLHTGARFGFAGAPDIAALLQTLAPPVHTGVLLVGIAAAWVLIRGTHFVLRPTSRPAVILVLLWALAPCLLLFAISNLTSARMFLPRYLLPAAPAVALLLALVLSSLEPARARGAVMVLMLAAAVWTTFGLTGHSHGGDWRRAMEAERAAASGGTPVLMRSGFTESNPFDWRDDDARRETLFAPLTPYPAAGSIVFLPLHLTAEVVRYLEQSSLARLDASGRFLLLEMGDTAYDAWLLGRLSPAGFVSRRLGSYGGARDSLRLMLFEKHPESSLRNSKGKVVN